MNIHNIHYVVIANSSAHRAGRDNILRASQRFIMNCHELTKANSEQCTAVKVSIILAKNEVLPKLEVKIANSEEQTMIVN